MRIVHHCDVLSQMKEQMTSYETCLHDLWLYCFDEQTHDTRLSKMWKHCLYGALTKKHEKEGNINELRQNMCENIIIVIKVIRLHMYNTVYTNIPIDEALFSAWIGWAYWFLFIMCMSRFHLANSICRELRYSLNARDNTRNKKLYVARNKKSN